MRLVITGMIGMLVLSACGGSSSNSNTCGKVLGTYTDTASEQWTNDPNWCVPPTGSFTVVLPNNTGLPSGCRLIGENNTANNCAADFQEVCTTYQTINNIQYTFTSNIIGTGDNNADGSKLVYQFSVAVSYNGTDGSSGNCNMSYTETSIRIHQ